MAKKTNATNAKTPTPKTETKTPKAKPVKITVKLVDPIIWTYLDGAEAEETVTRKGKKITVKVSEIKKGDVIYDSEDKASFVVS